MLGVSSIEMKGGKHKQLPIKQFEDNYWKQVKEAYRTGIIKFETSNMIYFVTYANLIEQGTWKTRYKDCQLILGWNKDGKGQFNVGIAFTTAGFPYPHERETCFPSYSKQMKLDDQVQCSEGQYLIQIKKQSTKQQWRIDVKEQKLSQIWVHLLNTCKKVDKTQIISHFGESSQVIQLYKRLTTVGQKQNHLKPLFIYPSSQQITKQQNWSPKQKIQNAPSPQIIKKSITINANDVKYKQFEQKAKKNLEKRKEQRQDELKTKNDQIKALQHHLKLAKEQIDQGKLKIKVNQQQIALLKEDLVRERAKLGQKDVLIKSQKQQLQKYQEQEKALNYMINDLEDRLNKQQTDFSSENTALLTQIDNLNKQMVVMKESIKNMGQTIDNYKKKVDETNQLGGKLEACQNKNKQLNEKIREINHAIFFHGDLLSSFPEHKQFIKKKVEKLKQRRIFRTSLIFKMDPLNTTSFHKYIDTIPDIVLVVKTKTGLFFGAYSESSFHPEQMADRQGIIFSISQQKVFPLLQGKRPVTYDAFYLIIGNSEIRLKQGEEKVFCNFGINNGHYNPKGSSVDDLLGEGKDRETLIAGYEIHHVEFQ